jgi:putative hydrolase of HD superfamily
MQDFAKLSDEEILKIAHQLRVGYKMKRVLRYNTKRDFTVHSESNAEHVFALIYLAHYFLEVEPVARSFDKEKLYSMLLFHDFAEIRHGDVNTYEKTKEDEQREHEAAKEVFDSLPEQLRNAGYGYWQEYEEQKSLEAHFAKALDRSEPLFELLDEVNQRSLRDLKITYEMNVGNKFPVVKDYPVLERFVEVISKDMLARGVFWE